MPYPSPPEFRRSNAPVPACVVDGKSTSQQGPRVRFWSRGEGRFDPVHRMPIQRIHTVNPDRIYWGKGGVVVRRE